METLELLAILAGIGTNKFESFLFLFFFLRNLAKAACLIGTKSLRLILPFITFDEGATKTVESTSSSKLMLSRKSSSDESVFKVEYCVPFKEVEDE